MLIRRKGSRTIFCLDISIHSSTSAQSLPAFRVADVLTKSTIGNNPFIKQNNNRAEEDPVPVSQSVLFYLFPAVPLYSFIAALLFFSILFLIPGLWMGMRAVVLGILTAHRPHSVSSPLCPLSQAVSYPYSASCAKNIDVAVLIARGSSFAQAKGVC